MFSNRKFQSLEKELHESFDPNQRGFDRILLQHYFTSNDSDTGKLLPFLRQGSYFSTEGDVALVLGESNIFSILPLMASQCVIVMDNDQALLQWLQFLKAKILSASNLSEFRELLEISQSPFTAFYSGGAAQPRPEIFSMQRKAVETNPYAGTEYEKQFYLASEVNFQRCKKALSAKKLILININLFDTVKVSHFCAILLKHQLRVCLVNYSNLLFYAGNCNSPTFEKALPDINTALQLLELVQDQQAIIMYSIKLENIQSLSRLGVLITKDIAGFKRFATSEAGFQLLTSMKPCNEVKKVIMDTVPSFERREKSSNNRADLKQVEPVLKQNTTTGYEDTRCNTCIVL